MVQEINMARTSNSKSASVIKRNASNNIKPEPKVEMFSVNITDKDDSNLNSGTNNACTGGQQIPFHEVYNYIFRPFLVSLLAVWPITCGIITDLLSIISFAAISSINDNSSMMLLCALNIIVLFLGFYIAINEGKRNTNDIDMIPTRAQVDNFAWKLMYLLSLTKL